MAGRKKIDRDCPNCGTKMKDRFQWYQHKNTCLPPKSIEMSSKKSKPEFNPKLEMSSKESALYDTITQRIGVIRAVISILLFLMILNNERYFV